MKQQARSRAIVYAPFFPPAVNGGGPIKSLAALVENVPPTWEALVVTSDRDLNADAPLPVTSGAWSSWRGHKTFYATTGTFSGLLRMWSAALRSGGEVVYVNSFFDWKFSLVPQLLALCRRHSPDVLVATRGEMGAGALSRRATKKKVLIAVYKFLRLHKRVTFHASTPQERDDIRSVLGPDVKVVVRMNDTLLPKAALRTPLPPRPQVLFVGRVVPHKGLLTALEAFRSVTTRVDFRVIGPAEDSEYAAACRTTAAELEHTVTFTGSADEHEVLDAMASSSFLVLPTAGENFGHVVAEALSVACPVVISEATPWSDRLRRHGAGLVVGTRSPEAWASALNTLLESDLSLGRAREGAAAAYDEWRSVEDEHVLDLAYPGPRDAITGSTPRTRGRRR